MGARPAQVSGDGWATKRPVGGLGRTPILGQKQLRGKRTLDVHSKQQKNGRQEREINKRKTSKKRSKR